jgi:hypothetical protein
MVYGATGVSVPICNICLGNRIRWKYCHVCGGLHFEFAGEDDEDGRFKCYQCRLKESKDKRLTVYNAAKVGAPPDDSRVRDVPIPDPAVRVAILVLLSDFAWGLNTTNIINLVARRELEVRATLQYLVETGEIRSKKRNNTIFYTLPYFPSFLDTSERDPAAPSFP